MKIVCADLEFKAELERHIRTCEANPHSYNSENGQNYYCFFCEAYFRNREERERHLSDDLCPEKVRAVKVMAGMASEAPSVISGRCISGLVNKRHSSWKDCQEQ